jgi:hypothetical protein
MNESTQIKFLRISYWAGAIFDAFVIIPMLSPKVASVAFGIPNFNPGNDWGYAMRVGASLMLGWVCLLLWADRKPVERKGVLLLTIFPVLVSLIYSGFYAVTTNLITARNMAPTWIMQGVLLLLYGFSYLNSKELDVNQRHK